MMHVAMTPLTEALKALRVAANHVDGQEWLVTSAADTLCLPILHSRCKSRQRMQDARLRHCGRLSNLLI